MAEHPAKKNFTDKEWKEVKYFLKDPNAVVDETEGQNEMSNVEEEAIAQEESQKQRVWRTLSKSNHSGYFVWEILAVIGDVGLPAPSYFTPCSDGSYIMIQCLHFWTKEQAEDRMNSCAMDEWQTIITID